MKNKRFYYKKSILQKFKGFCYAYKLGSITKASEKMGLSTCAISIQISSLENDIGFKLFKRTANHRIIPNKKAKDLYARLIPIIQEVDGVLDEFVMSNKIKRKNILNIACHHVVLTSILPPLLAKLKATKGLEKVRIKLFNIPKKEALEKTITNEIDLMIYPVEPKEKAPVELSLTKVLKYQSVVLLYKGHRLENKENIVAKDLKGSDFLLIDKFGVSKTMQHFIDDNNISCKGFEFVNGNWAILKSLVKARLGICSFSRYFINDEDLKELTIKPILYVSDKIYFSYLIKKNGFIKEGVKFLINELNKIKDF